MKTFLLILLALVADTGSGFAQKLIAVQNGGEPRFFAELDSAIVNAQNGDTVYIPGGTFPLTVTIDKRLHIIGVGHNLEANMATGRTIINGEFTLQNEAGGGSLMGLNGLNINGGENISNYMVRRCIFGSLILAGNNSNWTLIENHMQGEFLISYVTDFFFFNNIFRGGWNYYSTGDFYASMFQNNIFLAQDGGLYGSRIIVATTSLFENNIFLYSLHSGVFNSEFNNNLFGGTSPLGNTDCWGLNNMENQSDIFVNYFYPTSTNPEDYHIQESSPGKTGGKNGTEEGTEVGIYGGLYPWKEGALPPNPHIQLIDVAPGVDAQGNLNVRIRVEAQER